MEHLVQELTALRERVLELEKLVDNTLDLAKAKDTLLTQASQLVALQKTEIERLQIALREQTRCVDPADRFQKEVL
jgi:hypothetical protein